MMLSNLKSFSQNDMIIADDSLVCFPMRYLTFIREDLLKGDQNEKKVEQLEESVNKQQSENLSLKQKFQLQLEDFSSCRDSLEMKNAKIQWYHTELKKAEKKNYLYTGLIIILTGLFALK